MTLILTAQKAREIVYGDDHEYEVVRTTDEGTSRWSVHKQCIFAPIDKVQIGPWYRLNYSEGATESQDERAFEYDKEVTADEVIPVQVVKTEFKTKPVTITIEGKECNTTTQPPAPPVG